METSLVDSHRISVGFRKDLSLNMFETSSDFALNHGLQVVFDEQGPQIWLIESYLHFHYLPSGKLSHSELENHHAIFMGKSTISMVIFNSYVSHYQRVNHH